MVKNKCTTVKDAFYKIILPTYIPQCPKVTEEKNKKFP
jgi:hypothetical protein